MDATRLNGVVLGAVVDGMGAAADKFAERMDDIRDRRAEMKQSEYWKNYAKALADQVDDLTAVVRNKDKVISHKDAMLQKMSAELNDTSQSLAGFRLQSNLHSRYADLVLKRLENVEDIFQRQSAHSFALQDFCNQAIKELAAFKSPEESKLLDPVARQAKFEEAWQKFMATTSVKRGAPRIGVDKD